MRLKNTESQYGLVMIVLHWATALGVVFLFALGLWMVGLDYYSEWYRTAPDVHKSVGFIVVVMVLFRLSWRLTQVMPAALANHKSWEKLVSQLVHAFFYLAIVSMFVSGYLITTAKGQALEVLGFINIPSVVSKAESLEHIASDVHLISAYVIIGVMVLHGLAALKHHFLDKDQTLMRMFGS